MRSKRTLDYNVEYIATRVQSLNLVDKKNTGLPLDGQLECIFDDSTNEWICILFTEIRLLGNNRKHLLMIQTNMHSLLYRQQP